MACEYLYEGKWYTEDQLRNLFKQIGSTSPSKASPGTMKKIKEFLDRIGVEVQSLGAIEYNGRRLGVNGIADPLNGLIQVVQGKEDIALPEEAMHMAVELIQQKDPKLFKEMMDRIGRYNLFDRVMGEYQNNPFYQNKDGKPDIPKIKKEAIGKVLAQTVIDKNQEAQEKPELLVQTVNWWQRIIDFLKRLFLGAQFNPFETAATQVLSGQLEGSVTGSDGVFASGNQNVINATLKLVSSLRDPKAERWFKDIFQKGNRDQFFQKVQQDLQAPKAQIQMLKNWSKDKEFDSIGGMISGVLSELTYTVEINVASGGRYTPYNEMQDYEIDVKNDPSTPRPQSIYSVIDEDGNSVFHTDDLEEAQKVADRFNSSRSSDFYSKLIVPGGMNYRESEIKTPGIMPSIKGHAEFATDWGIGWFRSDDLRGKGIIRQEDIDSYRKAAEAFGMEDDFEDDDVAIPKSYETTKTRRILEIQSDLFQKGRDKNNLIDRFDELYGSNLNEEEKGILLRLDDVPASKLKPEEIELRDGISARAAIPLLNHPENRFLQILNREGNWVTFFVKAIIQDSAKKGYEKIVFPSGATANKIEGQETLQEFIDNRQSAVEEGNKYITESKQRLENIPEGDVKDDLKSRIRSTENLVMQYERELQDAREGRHKFSAIANFYQTTIGNILKKNGYNPKTVKDEHGNEWFEIEIKPNRDLGEFYFQLSGPQDIVEKVTQKDALISKRGDDYEINGNTIRNTIQKEVLEFYKNRLGAARAEKFLRGFKQETEGKVQLDIKDILKRYISDDNVLRSAPLNQTNPSHTDPNDNSFYMTLESHIQERLKTYEPGTRFLHNVNLYDGFKTAGTADLIAITPQGQVDILQFKVPQASYGAADIPVYRQEAYNIEVEALRRVLQNGYGVRRGDFRFTRAIPIKAEYENIAPGVSDKKLTKLTVGNTNVALIMDDLLLPISSESERTGDEKFDDYITRLRGLVQRLAAERVAPEKLAERSQRVAALVASIRKLQIKKDASALLASAKNIIKSIKEKESSLRDKISNTDPAISTIEELNNIASEILDAKDQVEIYKDMYAVFKNVFNDGTVDSEDTIKDARAISDDASDIVDRYLNLAVKFRTDKFAAKVGIKDEFTPEKKLSWYRRMIRSLSQSSTKAGAELWKLVMNINNNFKLQFLERLDELGKIEKSVDEWLKGKTVNDLYRKIFQYDLRGNWNGRIIQKISKQFYDDLKKAQESRDMKWVKDNIDTAAYMNWFTQEHQRRIDNTKTARISVDDAENSRLIQQDLQEFVDTFHIDFKKGVGVNNWALKNFPKEENWKSIAYQELERPENKPVFDLYEYYRKRLQESWELGMLHEHNGWSWFPNVRRNLLEKLSTAPAGGKLASLLGSIRIEAEDQVFGRIDPLTGKPIDEVHANFVSDLGQWVKDVDGNYFLDFSEKSMDLFKVIALWDSEIIKFKLRTESEELAKLIHYTEEQRKAYDSTATGKLKRNTEGKPIPISNQVNTAYIKEHIDAAYYGKALDDEFDVVISVPYKSAVLKINKLFGKEVLSVPEKEEIKVSGKKAIQVMNRYFVTKTLGVNLMTSIAQLFGGTMNTFINQGVLFNKKDLLDAEMQYVGARFYADEPSKRLAGLIGFIHPFVEDRTSQEIRKMSVSSLVKYLSSDHLFFMQRGSDNWVNTIIAIATLKNTMVHEGKLVNIRQFAKKELGHAQKYSGTYEEAKEFEKRLEKRVEELKNSPQALVHYAQIVDDKIVIPNISKESETIIGLRQQILEVIKDALGNTSQEDLSLYKRSIMWQSFFMFKNWIPRMADVRFGSLKYSPGTDKYEYGRFRMLWNAVRHMGLSSVTGLTKLMGNNSEPLIEVAKKEYAKKRDTFAEELQDLEMTEAEFIDMYIKGTRAQMKELMLAASLMALLIAMRANAPEGDDDPEVRGAYRWALRGLDKLTDELAFMYTPSSFTSILNGSVFPAVGVLVELQKFFTTAIEKLWYMAWGNDEKAEEKKVSKHLFKMLPITKELLQYLAIFNDDIAKEYGIRMNNQYGSVR